MKTLKTMILSLGAVVLLGASGLQAQTEATATIPFEFSVQNTTLPAGDYTMSAASKSHDVMSIENVETRKTILVLAPSNVSEYKGAKDKKVSLSHGVGSFSSRAGVKTAAVRAPVAPFKRGRELPWEGKG